MRWLKTNAVAYGIDTARVGVSGGSAGAHLAALLATGAEDPALDGDGGCPLSGDVSVNAVAGFYAPTDLLHWEPSYPSAHAVADLLGTPAYNSDPALAMLASPIDHISSSTPPFFLSQGTADKTVPYEQAVSMTQALHDAGIPATLITVPDAGHAFPELSPQPLYLESSCTFIAFMNKYLSP
jgi:acetyl esterase/lipase